MAKLYITHYVFSYLVFPCIGTSYSIGSPKLGDQVLCVYIVLYSLVVMY